MENVQITFQIILNIEKAPNGYQHVNFHIVLDIKMEVFHRKAHLVVEGHVTHTPDVITYFSMVSRETV